MLTIRLTRRGKKNQPFFKIVLIDKKRSSKGGRAVEVLGYINPLTKKKNIEKERVLYWISKGAQTSETMHNLLVKENIIEGKKIHVSRIKKSKLEKMAAEKAASKPIAGQSLPEAPAPVSEEPVPVQEPVPEISAPENSAEESPAEEAPKEEQKQESKPEEPVEKTEQPA